MIAFRVRDAEEAGETPTGRIQVVGSITGAVFYEQTVFRGEAAAVHEAVRAHPEEAVMDITLDCEGVLRRIRKRSPGHGNRDLLDPVRAEAHRLRLTWINPHLGVEAFAAKFGPEEEWRRQANCVVDRLVKDRAFRIAGPTVQAAVHRWDQQVNEVLQFLGQRVSYLLTADAADKADVVFQPKAGRNCRTARKPATTEQGDGTQLSRRQRLELLLQEGTQGGHRWQECHRGSTDLTVACSRCSLYVQQNDEAIVFERKLAQPCTGMPLPSLAGMHSSHQLESLGFAFICVRCKRVQKIGFKQLAPVFGKLCSPTQACESKLAKQWRQTREAQQHGLSSEGRQSVRKNPGSGKKPFKAGACKKGEKGPVQARLSFNKTS